MPLLGVSGAVIGGAYVPGDVSIDDGVIDRVGLPPGRGGLATPGFVDLQVNGFAGVDFLSANRDQWQEAERHLARTGVTEYVANMISSAPDQTSRALAQARGVWGESQAGGARLAGVHVEGPFLAPPRAGIHPSAHLAQPDKAQLVQWVESGPIVMMTLAPELPGATDLIAALRGEGIVVSLGHSEATYEEAMEGFDAGATTITHLFNAMSGISAREPGLAGAALSRPDVWLQLIIDLMHVDPVLVKLVASHAPERIVAVTDCLSVTGTDLTHLRFADSDIEVVDGRAVNAEGVLAGSVLQMDQALRHAVSCGMSTVDAVNATTRNPLAVLNRPTQSLLAPGSVADVVVLSDSLDVQTVLLAGVDTRMQEVC